MIDSVRNFIQRGRRGYSDSDVWDLGYYLAEILVGGLKKLKKDTHGYPAGLNSFEEWQSILQEMIDGFEAVKSIDTLDYMDKYFIGEGENKKPLYDWEKARKEGALLEQKVDKALDLLKEWFFALWD